MDIFTATAVKYDFRKEEDYIKTTTQTPNLSEEIVGTVIGHRDGHGFLQREDGEADIYLPPNEMRAVQHKDAVRVRVVRYDRKGRAEARVTEILERPQNRVIGRLLQEAGVWLVAPEDKRYAQDILISKNGLAKAKTGQVVVVELTEAPMLYAQPVGQVVEVLGEVDDPGMEIEIAVRKFDVPHVFSKACLDEAKALPDKVRAADKKGRVDLTDLPLVTIDGEDARDFDDAVYCEPALVGEGKEKTQGWRLLVAIADVSHYVQTGNGIDIDAYDRATSVYFPRRVIPMLPEKLSNGLCSLNPEVERLCMVADMLVDGNGGLHAYQFYPAVMYSHARMTYNEVAAILTNTQGPEAKQRKNLVPHLLHLHGVFEALLQARQARGAIDFNTTETQIVCNEAGRIEKIIPRTRNDAHRLIEEAMLAANVCAADFIANSKHPALYRVHEGPTPEKRELLAKYLQALGLGYSISADPRPAEFQRIASASADRPDALQIHSMLLRSMQQAIYTPSNSGHFGLAYEAYTHFTSPIRRYPDLLVHRVIKALLADKKYQLSVDTSNIGKAKDGRANKLNPLAKDQMWLAAGLHSSANERRADEASRDVEAWLKCKYMQEHLGEEFHGSVSSVTSFGLFILLDSIYVEGLVHISELGGDYFRYDEAKQELRGERTGIRYSIGSKVTIQVSRVDLDGRKIDFRLLGNGSGDSMKGKAASAKKMVDKAFAVENQAAVAGKSKKPAKTAQKTNAKTQPTAKRNTLSASKSANHASKKTKPQLKSKPKAKS